MINHAPDAQDAICLLCDDQPGLHAHTITRCNAHRWVTDVFIIVDKDKEPRYPPWAETTYGGVYEEFRLWDMTKVFCARCGVTAHDAVASR